MLSDVVIFSKLFSKSSIDFHHKTLAMLEKNLKYLLYKIYIKQFCNASGEKYLALIRILYPLSKYFVNPFVDIDSNF